MGLKRSLGSRDTVGLGEVEAIGLVWETGWVPKASPSSLDSKGEFFQILMMPGAKGPIYLISHPRSLQLGPCGQQGCAGPLHRRATAAAKEMFSACMGCSEPSSYVLPLFYKILGRKGSFLVVLKTLMLILQLITEFRFGKRQT